MKQSTPFCSVIVLNYFGEKVIDGVVGSLLKLNYPKEKLEIIVVDNNSKDKSREILSKMAKDHKNIKLINLDKNLGFSKGNNIGIKSAKGEYVALLNNDCVVEKNWLKQLVKTATLDEKIFAVNSKIFLYPKFINVRFQINPKLIPVFAWLSKSKLYESTDSRLYYLPISKKDNSFEIELPFEPFLDDVVEFNISFNSKEIKLKDQIDLSKIITFNNGGLKVSKVVRNGDDVEYKLTAKVKNRRISEKSLSKIQNAGIMVFQDGYGRDIGAIVSGNRQFHEYDLNQYDKEKEVYAACGAAVLYRKKILDKIGYLDESFFMYYEDVEISERARFAGFKSVYTPKAIVRHHHALFSKEWSPFFIYHVEKGRLLHLYYNFPFKIFLSAYFSLCLDSILTLFLILFRFRTLIYRIKSKKNESGETNFLRRIQMVKALVFFIVYSPFLLAEKIRRSRTRNKEAVKENYLRLLKGDWYLL